MRFARFSVAGGSPRHGIVEGDAVVEVEGDIFGRFGATSKIHSLSKIDFLPPVAPSKIVAVGVNFAEHAAEMKKSTASEPRIFLKPPSALLAHKGTILLPDVPGPIEHEAEVALVVGKQARDVPERRALDYVLGFTCFNDVTARALQKKDIVYARAKGFDTFAPAGPWIESDAVWEDIVLSCTVNGKQRQRGALAEMIFGVPRIVAFISRVMTLLPGDMISLGTPAGVGPLVVGDKVQVVAEGIGVLENGVGAR